jgi:glycosyltransferase involved in cell wall biosynthesis
MNVLHFVAGELTGGAARGAYWLHRGLREIGVDSHLMTNGRETYEDPSVISLNTSVSHKVKFSLLSRVGNIPTQLYRNRKGLAYNTGVAGIDITKHSLYERADIIHLHWINGLVAMHSLRKVKKPLIWTIRDMWPMTGGCHYSMECDRYTTGCGKCPQLGSTHERDLSLAVVQYKKKMLPQAMRLVGISQWLSECAEESAVFRGYNISTISNNINTNEFFPVEKAHAQQMLGLSTEKKIVLIGSTRLNDFYKGFSLFSDALRYLDLSGIHLVVFGKVVDEDIRELGIEYTILGKLTDTIALRLAYSAADVFVAPSRMDAFGKTLAESLACGTPVVCFDATGPKDIVSHKETGYKAVPFEPEDLAAGIDWVLSCSVDKYADLGTASRKRAVEYFDSKVIAMQYKKLYEECVQSVQGKVIL